MDASFWDEIERSRRLTGPERLSQSLELFDQALVRVLAGIRHQFPNATNEEALRIRRERLDRIRKIESLP
jgi:hypothetical protein